MKSDLDWRKREVIFHSTGRRESMEGERTMILAYKQAITYANAVLVASFADTKIKL
jgi:hypothetical protein